MLSPRSIMPDRRIMPVSPSPVRPEPIRNPLGGRLPTFKKGGKVKKTGPIYAHKGETVVPAKKKKN